MSKSKQIISKNDIISMIAVANDISKAEATRFVQSFFDSLSSELAKGNKVVFNGIISFDVATRKAREGRNPKTGAKIKIDAKKVITAKVSPVFSDSVVK
ncbi:MAG: hypothetical protein RL208_426 [Pseudomonadota bacterium]|jgi:DNA-binding protein HU-beta